MFARRNHILEQLGHTLRERSAAVVDAPLPAEMLSLVLKLASAEPRSALNAPSDPPSPQRLRCYALTRLSELPTDVYRARASPSVYPTVRTELT